MPGDLSRRADAWDPAPCRPCIPWLRGPAQQGGAQPGRQGVPGTDASALPRGPRAGLGGEEAGHSGPILAGAHSLVIGESIGHPSGPNSTAPGAGTACTDTQEEGQAAPASRRTPHPGPSQPGGGPPAAPGPSCGRWPVRGPPPRALLPAGSRRSPPWDPHFPYICGHQREDKRP